MLHLSSNISRKASLSATQEEDSGYFSSYLLFFQTRMQMRRRQNLLRPTVFLLGGKVRIWKQARELVVMNEPKSTSPLIVPTDKVTQGDVSLRLMQTSLRSLSSRMRHKRHIKDERKEIIMVNLPFDGSSHQTGDVASTSATPHNTRKKTQTHKTHTTRNIRDKKTK
jgi:hypothetical protein